MLIARELLVGFDTGGSEDTEIFEKRSAGLGVNVHRRLGPGLPKKDFCQVPRLGIAL